jgi:hypothetical protein
MFRSKRTAALMLLLMLVMVVRTAKIAIKGMMAARLGYSKKARVIHPGHCWHGAVGCCK